MLTPLVAAEFEHQLQKMLKSDAAIIVEGKKDRSALEKLGISCKIFVLSKKPLFAVAEEVSAAHREAIVLTDLDAEGRRLYGKLNTLLQQLGVKVDNRLRNFLFRNTKLRQIEGMASFIQQ